MAIIYRHKKRVWVSEVESSLDHSKVAATKLFQHTHLLYLKVVGAAMLYALCGACGKGVLNVSISIGAEGM